MTYQEFLDELTTYLTKKLPAGSVVNLSGVLKNNGYQPDCLTVSSPQTIASPALYPSQYYHRLQRQQDTFETVAAEILSIFLQEDISRQLDLSLFSDPSHIRRHLVCKLIHTGKNLSLLKTVPHLPFLDLSIVFFLLLPCREQDSAATVLIDNKTLMLWDLKEKELMSLARENTPRLLHHDLIPMNTMIRKVLKPDAADRLTQKEKETDMSPMFVLTNHLRLFGAGCLLYPHLLSDFSGRCGSDLYILPSSIHEVLLLPVSDAFSQEDLTQIVRQVNEDHVSQDEFLSDHAYLYSAKEQRIVC